MAVLFGGTAVLAATLTGYRIPLADRLYALLDPSYAKEHMPIIASVAEHQPTTWSSFFFDLHCLMLLVPVGLYFCCKHISSTERAGEWWSKAKRPAPADANIFVMMYGLTSLYFAGVMVKLMLVLSPAACLLGAIGCSSTLNNYFADIKVSISANCGPTLRLVSRESE